MSNLDPSISIHARTEARLKIAYAIQQGACNPRPIISELGKAVSECYTDGIAPSEDDAVFLILHQLVWVLADSDMGRPERWGKAYQAAMAAMKED